MTELNIFAFDDYRTFLAGYYNEQKKLHPDRFSFRYFNRRAGFKTSNFLYLVIRGKRNLTLESIKKIADVIPFAGRSRQYFENLVLFNQAKTCAEKTDFYEKLASFKEYQNVRLVTDSQKVYFSKWYYPVVREMVNLDAFRGDPFWIARHIQPHLTFGEAREAMGLLLKLGLVVVTPDGKWKQADALLKSQDQKAGHEVVAYHKQMIRLGFESLGKEAGQRDVSGMTMSLSPAKFALIRQKILSFREELQAFIPRPLDANDLLQAQKTAKGNLLRFKTVSEVCQLNIQFFKLASLNGRGS